MAELEKLSPTPSVSVILATYNRADYITKAIESVLNQSYPSFELIIIDDGSTDGTGDVVARYQDPRIIYKWTENRERSRARNLGIKLSRGKYIAFLDSDDWYLPNKLSIQVVALESNPHAGLVLGGWLILDKSGRKIQEVRPWEWVSPHPTLEEWLFSTTATPITLLVKKEWIERVGGFDPDLPPAEDLEWWIRLALADCPVVWTQDSIAVVLVHESNSLRNWAHVKRGLLDTLNKLFSNPKFKNNLLMSREEVYSRFHLALAWQAYVTGLTDFGKQELLRAVELNPKYATEHGSIIRKSLVDYSKYFLVADPIAFINAVLNNLPMSLAYLSIHRRDVLSKVWMSRAWQAHENGDLNLVRKSILHGVTYNPNFLRNRGVLSMIIQSLVGQRLWHINRQA